MTPLLQKLPLTQGQTFFVKTLTTPHFETGWHHHAELELILFTQGEGIGFVGNHAGEFKAGDVLFIGANVPHTFQRDAGVASTSAVVIQFKPDFWGEGFLAIPEAKNIRELFEVSERGIKLSAAACERIRPLMIQLENQTGFGRIINLCACLQIIASDTDRELLSANEVIRLNNKQQQRIDKVFSYTLEQFYRPISLPEIARQANMSVPAFCEYFKKSVRKTYVEFLNEIRLSHACKLLLETDYSVAEIYLQSGYNNPSNFNKQFLKYKGLPPSLYRKNFAAPILS